jgi:hypothetical protein
MGIIQFFHIMAMIFMNKIATTHLHPFSKLCQLYPLHCTPVSKIPPLLTNGIDEKTGKNKKLISISPGGLKGFYMLGVSAFIKEHYSLENYIFSGASAGAWNALFLAFKGEPIEFILELTEETKKAITIFEMEYLMKYRILQKYKDSDFDLEKLFIGVTTLENMKFKSRIYSNFTSVEDAINCCIASSHIPYITGGFKNIYHNHYSFDGGFSTYPYIQHIPPSLHITPSMWRVKTKPKTYLESMLNFSTKITDYTTLFSKDKYDYYQLFDSGYNDAKTNRAALDKIFDPLSK